MKECKYFSQDLYDTVIEGFPLHTVRCTCGSIGELIRYGHYHRTVKFMSQSIRLCVVRVMCKNCGHTHAILLSVIVPYSQVMLRDHQDILIAYHTGQQTEPIMERNILIDENTIKYVVRQYLRHWKQRLLSMGASLMEELTPPCFANYSRQFMQIHRTRNILHV